ncbi:MAG: TonB-dependent receptor [Bacteroidia bacterium]|nr:TonB-dependent receptor [Bacteroidia bacterium]
MFSVKYKSNFILGLFLMLSGLGAFAQGGNDPKNNPMAGQDSLILENERIFDIMESEKTPVYYPVREMETPDVTEIQFLSKDYYFDSKVEAPEVLPEKFVTPEPKKEDIPRLFNHYVKLGVGKYLTPYARLYLGSNPDKDVRWGVNFQHLSAHLDKIPLRNFRNDDLGVQFSSDKKNHWEVSLKGGNNQYFLYGTPAVYEIKTPSDAMKDSLRRGFSYADVRFQADNKANREKFYYNIPVSLTNIWDRRIADSVSGNSEYNIGINPDLAFFFNDFLSAGIQPQVVFSIGKIADNSTNRILTNTLPYVSFEKKAIKVKAGANLGYFNQFSGPVKGDDFRVFPSVEAEYKISRLSMSVLAGYKGGFLNNTYRDMLSTCRYLDPSAQIRPTIEKMNVFIGSKAVVKSRYDINFLASYRKLESPLLYTGFENNGLIQAVYDSLTTNVGVELETNYSVLQEMQIGGAIVYNYFKTTSAKAYFGVAPLELRLFSRLQFLENRLNLRPAFYLYSKTPMGLTNQGAVAYRGITPDFNINAEYRITERFSAWVQFNNMFAANNFRYYGYPERRFDFLGGIGFIF